jgi:hypothetical protein
MYDLKYDTPPVRIYLIGGVAIYSIMSAEHQSCVMSYFPLTSLMVIILSSINRISLLYYLELTLSQEGLYKKRSHNSLEL